MRIRFIERWRLCVVNDLSTVTIKILSSYYNISSRPNLSWHKLDNNKPEALRPYEFFFGDLIARVSGGTKETDWWFNYQSHSRLGERSGKGTLISLSLRQSYISPSPLVVHLMLYCNLICYNFVSFRLYLRMQFWRLVPQSSAKNWEALSVQSTIFFVSLWLNSAPKWKRGAIENGGKLDEIAFFN